MKNDSIPSHNSADADSVLRVEDYFAAAAGKIVVVAGDLMLDEWIIGQANRISPEAPVPVVRLTERRTAPGGAANVAMNLLRLGARVRVVGVVGEDDAGRDLARELEEAGADVSGLVRDAMRPTTLKTRIVAQRQQMVRVDRESDEAFSQNVQDDLSVRLKVALNDAAALCISDYDKGMVSCGVLAQAVRDAQSSTRIGADLHVTGGPKPHNMNCFAQADFLSLNQTEASEASGLKLDSLEAVEAAGEALRLSSGARALVITRGGRGVSLFQEGQKPCHIAAHEVEVFDVAGAGDSFLAAATAALTGGADALRASEIGNLAAAASVRHVGVVAVTPEEVRHVAEEI